MILNFSIHGTVTINGEKVDCEFILENLTNYFKSNKYISDIGYYNSNLANFPGEKFNDGDLLMLSLNTRHNKKGYGSKVHTFLDASKDFQEINVELQRSWNYTADIIATKIEDKINIKFITNHYQHIVYKLYIYYKDGYKELETVKLDRQEVNLNLTSNGDYRLVGYVMDGDKLLTYNSVDFNVKTDKPTNDNNEQTTYFDWE